tara:strand:+ start:35 stop:361 length:327 start_codon:yes stop_codon:yes gene_type:complete
MKCYGGDYMYNILYVDCSSRVGLEYMSNRLCRVVNGMSYEDMLEYVKILEEDGYENIGECYDWNDLEVVGNKDDIKLYEDYGDSSIYILNENVSISEFCKNNGIKNYN